MNHHLPAMPPYGQPPGHPSRRQHDPYQMMPPNTMRHHPGYQNGPAYPQYYPPHMGGPMPPYPPQGYPQWYNPYAQMPPPPPRSYQHPSQHPQQPYAPLVISPYSQQQPPPAQLYSHPPPSLPTSPPRPISSQAPSPAPQVRPSQASSPAPFPPSDTDAPIPQPPPSTAATSTPLESPFSPPPPSTPSPVIAQETPPSTSSDASGETKTTPTPQEPFFPPLPWISTLDDRFPSRAPKIKRKVTPLPRSSGPVEFLVKPVSPNVEPVQLVPLETDARNDDIVTPAAPEISTPQTSEEVLSEAQLEEASTQPTTPSSVTQQASVQSQKTPTQTTRTIHPVVPVIPILPKTKSDSRRPHGESLGAASNASKAATEGHALEGPHQRRPSVASTAGTSIVEGAESQSAPAEAIKPAAVPPPKSWADLVRKNVPATAQTSQATPASLSNGLAPAKNETLSDVLNTLGGEMAKSSAKIAFLQPRGLVNTGNMCYMNSILQVLIFCLPFYELLERVSRRAAHSFKSDTPLIDALIEFMREYKVLFSAESLEQLRLRLRSDDVEDFGEAFIPEYVYQVIKQLPRFRDMRRGHQQDAQEFLGFLLEELHDECVRAMRSGGSLSGGPSTHGANASSELEAIDDDGGWQEVGHKQKPAITRNSGIQSAESPITKIFGGKIRSEFRVTGNKNSVTLEPFQSLQLDIGSSQVNNIEDALKGLTRPENMQGSFKSPRGTRATATKQVFIETLPPVLILHLKRFHYDSTTKRTEKIWKQVGYPLELEIPREVFPPPTRNKLSAGGGFPKYRLIGAIYHHGKYASGGHYTVDVRRQDGAEWIRLDDTVIRRIRSQDVAEGGSEEDPKILAALLKQHEQQKTANSNIYEQIDQDDKDDDEEGWNQVNGSAGTHSRSKSIASLVNGTLTPATTKASSGKQTPISPTFGSAKDSKVAYLLFYQRIRV